MQKLDWEVLGSRSVRNQSRCDVLVTTEGSIFIMGSKHHKGLYCSRLNNGNVQVHGLTKELSTKERPCAWTLHSHRGSGADKVGTKVYDKDRSPSSVYISVTSIWTLAQRSRPRFIMLRASGSMHSACSILHMPCFCLRRQRNWQPK